jgi:hypothetical protein
MSLTIKPEDNERTRLEDELWRLTNSYGNGAVVDGRITERIVAINERLSQLCEPGTPRYSYQTGMAGHHGFTSKCTFTFREGYGVRVATRNYTCVIQNLEGHIMRASSGTTNATDTPQSMAEEQLQSYLRDHPHA